MHRDTQPTTLTPRKQGVCNLPGRSNMSTVTIRCHAMVAAMLCGSMLQVSPFENSLPERHPFHQRPDGCLHTVDLESYDGHQLESSLQHVCRLPHHTLCTTHHTASCAICPDCTIIFHVLSCTRHGRAIGGADLVPLQETHSAAEAWGGTQCIPGTCGSE